MTIYETSTDGVTWKTWDMSADVGATSYLASVYAQWCADQSPFKRTTVMPDPPIEPKMTIKADTDWRHDRANGVQITGNAWRGGRAWEHPRGWWIANAYEGFNVKRWVDLPDESTAKRTIEEWLTSPR